jgi:iron complex outermembrane receptor protein
MWQSDMQFLIYDTVEYNSGTVYEGGVRAGFAHQNGRWDVALFGRNITDEANLKGVIDFNNNTGFVNDRRIWGATLNVNFGD